ncbi:hypothetical protein NLJ89_g6009 [Agrocybe chaxingu]|uniref:AAA+ ATPase domain-containing protein n=1 Tax=Agrocybe chaxingu TaxID=84603 RepID=A0A9W8JZN7_9AGAR|nr:hypothetical protein NLJ89_g6009 [Agrocybe chaxingu]
MSKVVGNPAGFSALQTAIRYDLSTTFLNTHASSILQYLQHPDIKAINNGMLLDDVLVKLVEPPIFWFELRKAFLKKELDEEATVAFAWLLQQLCMLQENGTIYQQDPEMPAFLKQLQLSPIPKANAYGRTIERILATCTTDIRASDPIASAGPGGRHDNDFPDFRKIAILPTWQEMECDAPPFLRPSSVLEDPETESSRVALHLDNQFRLLREDMIYEMRDELTVATGKRKGYHKGMKMKGLEILDIDCGKEGKPDKWGLICVCKEDFPALAKLKEPQKRKAFLIEKPNFFRHQSLACLLAGKEIIGFPSISRDEDRLAKNPPEIILQFEEAESTKRALLKLKMEDDVTLIQINTAVFAFEPVLKGLQQAKLLPLSSELLLWKKDHPLEEVQVQASAVVRALRNNPGGNLKNIIGTAKDIKLDPSQAASLISGLTQRVSLIQGPPGTGKSFIGALIAKSIHNHTEQTILVVCYTNHALDDILTGLLDIGIPESSMLRLGGKSTARTEPLSIFKQARAPARSRIEWTVIDELKNQLRSVQSAFRMSFDRFNLSSIRFIDILEYLEFDDPAYFKAFKVPNLEDDMEVVGRGGKAAKADYLLDRWVSGQDAGVFSDLVTVADESKAIWNLPLDARYAKMDQWEDALLQESIASVVADASEYNRCQKRLQRAFSRDNASILRAKQIVGCTTTAAAKYCEEIQTFNPDVLLVEEAGEILESHVLTSLGPETSQMILIGDHKQLRPKVNNYRLTVEKGDGYDLNRSLFERLILKDYPHESLSQQHRMRPEIAALIRHLTYPELTDAPKTQNRPNLRGVQDNIVFIDHDHPEDENKQLADRSDMASTSSKQNSYEAIMILKIVKYLAQQGYGTDQLVVLTPYLGQLHKLREFLKKDNDPILNDLDSHELVKAGLMDPSTAKNQKRPIRLATIDNYQGEESDIVIVSLTRSNPRFDIGFMFSPERLNVLLSRARNALIMLGNSNTFRKAKKGKELWQTLFNLLSDGKHMYRGFPVQSVSNFPAACTTALPDAIGWTIIRKSNGPPRTCHKCERAKKLAKEQKEREAAAQERRDAEQKAHLEQMDALNAAIEQEIRRQQDERLRSERAHAVEQKRRDLENLQASRATTTSTTAPLTQDSHPVPLGSEQPTYVPLNRPQSSTAATPSNNQQIPDGSGSPSSPLPTPSTSGIFSLVDKMKTAVTSAFSPAAVPQPPPATTTAVVSEKPFKDLPESKAKLEWIRQKQMEGARNDAIDAIMGMTGLEAVKEQVLAVQAKINVSLRQNTSLKQERFNVVLLGNPGTGKTTIARHYAKFLASVKAIPGNEFEEKTGAQLAQEGVAETQKLVEKVTKAGGGAIFIDEAYQLTSGNNPGGAAVLDYLLAEMENRVGTLVFILAGYNREMEKFFEHNPGLRSRVPYEFNFADYKDEELMSMLESMVNKFYNGMMKVEGGIKGLYGRITIRRLGRRRGHPGFGNARDLQGVFSKIRERQAVRITKERKEGKLTDDFLMLKDDIIGPDPSKAILESEAWKELQGMIGLQSVKDTVASLVSLIGENYQRELLEREPMELTFNRVFLGSPGTGKTTVAKLFGQILADLGLLSNGEVITKNPSDFVGAVLGASEANTKAILANGKGKVLIIDEAYMLYGGGSESSSGGQSNQFKTTVIDTIVAEVQNIPGEDRCVLMLGYKDQMTEMFQNVNPGLARRFKIEDAFQFEDFSDTELQQIMELKLKKQDLGATDEAKRVAIELLRRMRNRPNFGNAGEVENLIVQGKTRCLARRQKLPSAERPVDVVFEPGDFDPDYKRSENAPANLTKLFSDIVGHSEIIQRLRNYQEIANTCKARGMDARDRIPTNFIFTGPPGTGKTTVARKIGQVFYDMGLLSSGEVVECSASDLVGQYVGQTGPKTKKLFEKALGKVLFVDEAYRLSEGHFAQEAIDELVGLLTHPNFKSKLIVILAGYEADMQRLMAVNTGLSSRFPDQVVFENMSADYCLQVVEKELKKNNVEIIEDGEDDDSPVDVEVELKGLIEDLSQLPDWGNARDMMTFSKGLVNLALLKDSASSGSLKLSGRDIINAMEKMTSTAIARANPNPQPSNSTIRFRRRNLTSRTSGPSTSLASSSSGRNQS